MKIKGRVDLNDRNSENGYRYQYDRLSELSENKPQRCNRTAAKKYISLPHLGNKLAELWR